MKPYGREKNLRGRGLGKIDVHARPKYKWKNWWEDMISPITRGRMKQIVKKEVEIELNR